MFSPNRDFGNHSQSQWNNHNNNNRNRDNNDHNNFQMQPQIPRSNQGQYFERSLIPTTAKKILMERSPEPDEPFRIDGIPVHQVSVIGKLLTINPQTTHTLFIIDDQNIKIKCKLWTSSDDDIKEMTKEELKAGDLVKVIGKIDTFKSSRSINIHNIQKIKDFNQVYLHGLECIFAHQLNTIIVNQHIPQYKAQFDEYITRSQHEQQQRNKEYEQYRQQQQQQQQQMHLSPARSYNNNSSPNRFGQQQQRQRQWSGDNQNGSYNQSQRVGNVGNGGNNNRYAQGSHRGNDGDEDPEAGLNQFEKRVLLWMKRNYTDGDAIGHSRDIIKQGVNCWNDQQLHNALKELHHRGLIVDTVDDSFCLFVED